MTEGIQSMSTLGGADAPTEILRAVVREPGGQSALRVREDLSFAFLGDAPFAGVDARCEGCGMGFVFDDLRLLAVAVEAGPSLECADCGCPVYLVPEVDELGAA